jgi:hypothetical protein
MKKLNISINLLQLQGACKATIKGEDCVVIRIAKSRAKPHQNGSIYLDIEAVEKKEVDKFGKTHFVAEPLTKEEREGGMETLYIGNGKEWSNEGKQGQARQTRQASPTRHAPQEQAQDDGTNGDEIPF